jgi:hypothetical protein
VVSRREAGAGNRESWLIARGVRPSLGALIGLLTVLPGTAGAHQGPPFPILTDRRVGPYVVSVWADPDIGVGRFFVILEAPGGGRFSPVTWVRVAVTPASGRLGEALYEATPQSVRRGARYLAQVRFDRGEWWHVRVIIEGAEGGGELEAEVEATPAGVIGPIGLVIYALPFLAVAGLWIRAALARRHAATAPQREGRTAAS